MSRIKRLCFNAFSIAFTAILFIYPVECAKSATAGLIMFYNNVLVVMFPFFVISGLYPALNFYEFCARLCGGFFHKFFNIRQECAAVFFTGAVLGYPSGVRVLSQSQISLTDKQKLTTAFISSAPGTLFCLNMAGVKLCADKFCGLIVYFGCIVSILFVGFIYANFNKEESVISSDVGYKKQSRTKDEPPDFFRLFTYSVTSSVGAIINIGGYIVFFSIVRFMFNKIFPPSPFQIAGAALIELTIGLNEMQNLTLPLCLKTSFAAFICTFGGGCVIAQITEYLNKMNISLLSFFVLRVAAALLSFCLVFVLTILLY